MPLRIAIRKAGARQYYFVLVTVSGTVLMTSEAYRRKSEARRFIEFVIANFSQEATIEDETGEVTD